jgi:hypothetical protein
VLPGYHWGGEHLVNPGYFAPAWYRIFDEHDPGHDWRAVVDRSYEVLEKSPGYEKGLVPDWMTAWGEPATDLEYNAYGNGWYMYKDAIRVLWPIGTDLLWNNEPRARRFLEHAYRFIQTREPDFFRMDGSLVPPGDVWVFDGGAMSRHRREHSPLTAGMWLVPVWLLGTEQEKTVVLNDLLSFRRANETFWASDGEPNELYFEQFLGTFGWSETDPFASILYMKIT